MAKNTYFNIKIHQYDRLQNTLLLKLHSDSTAFSSFHNTSERLRLEGSELPSS